MSGKPKLMKRLDDAAEQLLDRYFKMPELDAVLPKGDEQIKAFDAVVKYFGPRTKLGGNDEDKKESEFDQLRAGLNGSRAPRRRPGAAQGRSNGPTAGDDPAGTA
jgi:hypothetical protein